MDAYRLTLIVGWASMLVGALSGALIGVSFHEDRWLDGYSSWRRRLLRLGHIASFGLGLLNIAFALSADSIHLPGAWIDVAAIAFITTAVSMPACCFLAAWRHEWRRLFPIPVASALVGLACAVVGLLR